MSMASKVVEESEFKNPKNYFHVKSKKLGCTEEMVNAKIELSDCMDSREYCDAIMARYVTLLDNATFMPFEHIQKEKEYGIIWRSAFKAEMHKLVDGMARRLVSSDGFAPEQDPFQVLHKIIVKDCQDAATFDMRTQADLMCMLVDNLEIIEKVAFQIKAMLKEPEPDLFEDVKGEVLAKLKVTHEATNPGRPESRK